MFYVSLAFGFLAKGPVGWTPLVTVAATKFFLLDGRFGSRFQITRGLLLMLAIVALWGAPALIRTHGQFFAVGIGRHVISRSFTTMEGHGANSFGMYLLLLPFYFVTIFVSFFPWSIKLPWLTRQLWQDRDKIDNYLITGVVIIFVIFTSVKTQIAALHPAGFPPARASACPQVGRRKINVFPKKCAVASVSIYLGVALIVPSLVGPILSGI